MTIVLGLYVTCASFFSQTPLDFYRKSKILLFYLSTQCFLFSDRHAPSGDCLHLSAEGGASQRAGAGGVHWAEPPWRASNPWQSAVEHLRPDGQACLDQLGQPGHIPGKELLHWRRRGHAKPRLTSLLFVSHKILLRHFPVLDSTNSSQRSVMLRLTSKH